MSSSSKGLVLVTGANGFIAAVTVAALLKAGYSVRGSVRSAASGAVLHAALPEASASGLLTTVVVPDITVPGAFDSAVVGCTAIAHLASPVDLHNTDAEYVLGSAIRGTTGVMQSALKAEAAAPGTLRAVVYMSSIVAIRNFPPKVESHISTEADWNDVAEQELAELGSAASGNTVYTASKVKAEKAFWAVREANPALARVSMSAVHPVWVGGPPLILPEDPNRLSHTAIVTYGVMAGWDVSSAGPCNGANVDVRDVARLVVFGIEHADAADGQRYIAGSSGNFANVQAQHDILRKAYPDRRHIIKEGNPGEGYRPDYTPPPGAGGIDGTKAVKATGQDWIPFEKMVLDAAKVFEAYF